MSLVSYLCCGPSAEFWTAIYRNSFMHVLVNLKQETDKEYNHFKSACSLYSALVSTDSLESIYAYKHKKSKVY